MKKVHGTAKVADLYEIAALFGVLVIDPVKDAHHRLRWSTWRRRHQHRARACHYQRQARQP
jgi:hypothetical protein